MDIYLVYEHENFDEYVVILLTKDEEKAKCIFGESKPCDWSGKKMMKPSVIICSWN
ncbi:MAG: hypothetical protein GX662_11155 [Trichococcus flocculiformis]|uniref:Uncharacterized protein n=1 Tax=Trichococcus flocculiformis TaxID=82803 RepID=A0A847D8Q3_9LACT|nr:hypothetical protein [Trichococcus flocculiformis]NLD32794.1 hypothetical protein [Trichococcus flocculiformis]